MLTIVLTALAIYFTPLKNIALIEPKIKDIPSADFAALYQQNPEAYDFIDVRPAEAYNKIHADGSRNLPLHTLYNERKFLPKRGKTLVLICSGGLASGVGYHYLEHHGFMNLLRIEGGIESWIEAGLPTVSNSPF